jgi:amino acid transporter
MMPVNGGYYIWVYRALGLRWAFYEGWWTLLYSFTDLAIYPVLFVTYLSFFFPGIAVYKIPFCLLIIWGCSGLNILGIVRIGNISIILGAIVLIPFLILFWITFSKQSSHFTLPAFSLNGIGFTSLGMALYTIMWNISGWDNTTTYAGEVDKPIRSYLISMGIAFILVIVLYLLTTYIAQNSGIDFNKLSDSGYPLLGAQTAGSWLGTILSLGGMASTLGIFSTMVLSISRIPKVMADDRLLPLKFSVLHKKYNTPYISIIVCAIFVSFMVLWKFTDLIVIDIILYGAGLFLEFVSLIVLRIKEPAALRPFKIPLGTFWLCLLVLLPMVVYGIAIIALFNQSGNKSTASIFAVCAIFTAEIAWLIAKKLPFPKS